MKTYRNAHYVQKIIILVVAENVNYVHQSIIVKSVKKINNIVQIAQ